MRFNILQVLCLTASVLALPIENTAQDITIIQRSMKNVSSALGTLRSALHSITPRMSNADVSSRWPEVERVSRMMTQGMNSDALEIRKAPTMNIIESSELLAPINDLESATQQVVNEWIAIKPAINNRDKQNVVKILKDHQAAAGQYADALLSRQSGLAAPAGRYFGSKVQQTIEQAVTAYRV
jgi:hypothetical protein